MGELGAFFGGLTGKSKADFSNGEARYVSYMNIASNLSIDLSREDFVNVSPGEKQNEIQLGDILFTGSSETRNEVGITSGVDTSPREPVYLNSFCFGFRPHPEFELEVSFAKHLFRSEAMRTQIVACSNGVTRFNLSKVQLSKALVPVPLPARQIEIARILDQFEALLADVSIGLPTEIRMRQQQYEHYRNQLLAFKELEA